MTKAEIVDQVHEHLSAVDYCGRAEAADYVVLSEPRELPPAGLLGAFLAAGDDDPPAV